MNDEKKIEKYIRIQNLFTRIKLFHNIIPLKMGTSAASVNAVVLSSTVASTKTITGGCATSY